MESKTKFSIPSLISLIAAILIFVVDHGFLVFVLAGVSIFFGLIGLLISFLPRVRGGVVSFFSIFAGLIGVIISVVKLID
ncbi:MAG: hypothetical protein V4733_08650 [Verrucomicrobiota bacterium]